MKILNLNILKNLLIELSFSDVAINKLINIAEKIKSDQCLENEFSQYYSNEILSGNWTGIWHIETPSEAVKEKFEKEYTLFYLLCYLEYAFETKAKYSRLNIPYSIYTETLSDISIWLENWYNMYGYYCFNNLGWIWRHLTADLFKIGRLQYQKVSYNGGFRVYRNIKLNFEIAFSEFPIDINYDGNLVGAGDLIDDQKAFSTSFYEDECYIYGTPVMPSGKVVNKIIKLNKSDYKICLQKNFPILEIHIPKSGTFDEKTIAKSYEQALEFYSRYFNENNISGLSCHTWMFTPQIKDMVDSDSNILKFQKEFYLFPHSGSYKFMWNFVFSETTGIDDAPEDSKLRRKLKEYVKEKKLLFDTKGVCLHNPQEWGNKSTRYQTEEHFNFELKHKYFSLPQIFQSKMVLQQNKPIKIYGTAYENITINAVLSGENEKYEETFNLLSGDFKISLPSFKFGTGYTLMVYVNDQIEIFNDVSIGEVWVASGQSNMAMSLNETSEYNTGLRVVNSDKIRFYTVGRNSLSSPAEYSDAYKWAYAKDSGWLNCSDETAKYFSAVGYHFAVSLNKELDVPVGIINCSVGGSNIRSWLPEDLNASDNIKRISENSVDMVNTPLSEKLSEKYKDFLDKYAQLEHYNINISGTKYEKPYIYFDADYEYSYKRSSSLYKSMLKKISSFQVKGMIWYQGESQALDNDVNNYLGLMINLINTLKTDLNTSEYAFEYVQLAPWENSEIMDWEDICNQQREFALKFPKYGMITIGDLGGGLDIHPPVKQKVGERLALAALNNEYSVYGEYSGPIAKCAIKNINNIIIYFIHCNKLDQKSNIGDFEIIYSDGSVEKQEAVISFDCVYLSYDNKKYPEFVQYEYTSNPKIGLFNGSEFPASIFKINIEDS